MLASRRVATRISGRFARKKAKNDLKKQKPQPLGLGFSLKLLDYQEDLVIPGSSPL
jgi:hypothetical protein